MAKGDVRKFETGATRDVDNGKLDYEGFLSPLVLERFARYMHAHRFQKDGKLRDSDNWQKGIPRESYMKSLCRHFMDAWRAHRGWMPATADALEDMFCAILFNASGYLHEHLAIRYLSDQAEARLHGQPKGPEAVKPINAAKPIKAARRAR
jgi:hypothetical protein